jgi:tetratricopeptide (TPR) repeat protein
VYSGLALVLYIWKAVIPLGQSAIYAFPPAGSAVYFGGLIFSVVLVGLMIYLVIRFWKTKPALVFGIIFFLTNIFLTLHVVAVNSSLIYERFTYIGYIGLFFIAANAEEFSPKNKSAVRNGLLVLLPVFTFIAYNRTQVWKDTETIFSDVIEKNPLSMEAYTNRGQYYNDRGELDKALEDFTKGIEVNPRHPNAYSNRSVVYFKRQDYARALADNDSALRREPGLIVAISNRGDIFFNMKQYDTAIYYYSQSIFKQPDYANGYLHRGSAFLKKGMNDDAIRDYNKAIELSPGMSDAYKYLSMAYIRKQDLKLAEQYMTSAMNLDPNSDASYNLSREYLRLGNDAYAKGNQDQALSFYQEALRVKPGDAESYFNIGGIYLMRQDVATARQYWQKALQSDPSHQQAKEWLQKTGG